MSLIAQLGWGATWPVWRGSKERTATVAGAFAEGAPTLAFKLPLGGEPTRSVSFPSAMPGILLSAVGGQVQATRVVSGQVEWRSPMLSDLTLVGSADLDDDGVAEVVAFTRRQAFAFSSVDGSVVWSSVFGEHSTIAAVRLADTTGDGSSEVLIDDCATCGIPGPLVGEVISFAGGVASTLWTVKATDLPYPYHQGTDGVLLGLGDGRPLLGLPTLEDYRLVDGATGVARVVIPRGPYWFAQTAALAAGPEQVLLLRATGNAKGALPPAVISLHVSPDVDSGEVAWQYAGDVYSTLDLSETAVADLDGDGAPEVVLSELSGRGEWSLVVLDAATGDERARVLGWKHEGTLGRVQLETSLALIASGPDGLSLAVFRDGEFRPLGEPLRDWSALTATRPDSLVVGPVRGALAHQEVTGETSLLVGNSPEAAPDLAGRFATIGWATIDGAGLHLGATHTPANPVTALFPADNATRPYAQFAIGTTDGAVTVLDRKLRPSSGSLYKVRGEAWYDGARSDGARSDSARSDSARYDGARYDSAETQYPGTPIGGRQPTRTHLIGQSDTGPFVVVPNTASGTIIADASRAGLVTPPSALWSSARLVKPSVLDGASGPVVAGVEGAALVLKQAWSGELVASAALDASALGPLGDAFNEPLLVSHDDGAKVVALDWQLPAGQVAQRGFAWTDEGLSETWTSEAMTWGGGFFSSAGRYQFEASAPSTDVIVFATNGQTLVRRADTGQTSVKAVYTGHYTLPMFADFTTDGATDILFQAGFVSPWVYGPNWTTAWQKSDPLPTYGMAGALIPCAAGPRYVTPFLRSPRFMVHDGKTGTVLSDQVAAGGALFASETAAREAGALAGFLSNTSTLEGPFGTLVLFGSTDGHLYALDGCGSLGLVWALDAETPLGEPSIGDWDGDGNEELLVGASSGHVLGVDFGRLPAPDVVIERVSHHTARVAWSAIDGATAYEYALVTPAGTPVWSPAYRRTRGTHATVNLQPTLAERPFRVAVRALASSSQPGTDGFSAAVSLSDTRAPLVHAGWNREGSLWFAAADNQALDHYLIYGQPAEGEPTLLDDGFLSGHFAQRTGALDGASDFDALVVVAVDAAGNRAERAVARQACPGHRRHHTAR